MVPVTLVVVTPKNCVEDLSEYVIIPEVPSKNTTDSVPDCGNPIVESTSK